MTTAKSTITDAVDRYLSEHDFRNASIVDREHGLRAFTEYMTERNIETVNELRAYHAQGYVLTWIGRVWDILDPAPAELPLRPLVDWGAWLEDQGFVKRNPFRHVAKPRLSWGTRTAAA